MQVSGEGDRLFTDLDARKDNKGIRFITKEKMDELKGIKKILNRLFHAKVKQVDSKGNTQIIYIERKSLRNFLKNNPSVGKRETFSVQKQLYIFNQIKAEREFLKMKDPPTLEQFKAQVKNCFPEATLKYIEAIYPKDITKYNDTLTLFKKLREEILSRSPEDKHTPAIVRVPKDLLPLGQFITNLCDKLHIAKSKELIARHKIITEEDLTGIKAYVEKSVKFIPSDQGLEKCGVTPGSSLDDVLSALGKLDDKNKLKRPLLTFIEDVKRIREDLEKEA